MNLKRYDFSYTRDYFAEKNNFKKLKFSWGNIFLYRGYCQKIGVPICRNSFSRRNKYLHVQVVVSTSSFNFVKRPRSAFC